MDNIKNTELLERCSPAVFATEPADRVSDRYSFLPTTRVLNILQEEGWTPWMASQVQSKDPARIPSAKHLIRLRHESLQLDEDATKGDLFPEMLLINSHDGLSSYQLRAGVFRMVCSNGLVVSKEDFGTIRIRHQGFNEDEVYRASQAFCENTARLNESINDWREYRLSPGEIASFAHDAAQIRFDQPGDDIVLSLTQVHREEDQDPSLWNVFNVVQENMLRGGYLNQRTRRRVRPIKSIQKDVKFNSELWELASNYSKR
tara:strand:- start:315 stop:1094 length:780 start_codon:yes stop_codon:yes gene_type:complete